MVYFCSVEVAVVKDTIDESYRDKTTLGEIAAVKNAGFKLHEIDFLFSVSDVIVLYVKIICRHYLVSDCFYKNRFLQWLNYYLIV